MRGSLSETSFADLLQSIDSTRKSCVLELTPARGGRPVRLFFQAARLIRVEVARRERRDLLGEMLLRSGRVTADELNSALKVHKKTLRRLGDVLVQSEAITAAVAQEFVDLQAQEVLHALFEWSEGEYAFSPAPSAQESIITPVNAEQLLMKGFTLLDEWPVIRARVNNYSVVYRAMRSAPSSEGRGALTANAVTVLALVNAARDVNAIIDRSGLGEFETCKALSALLTHGFIVPVDVRSAVDDPSGRQTRGWLGKVALIMLNLVYLAVFGVGAYWMLFLAPAAHTPVGQADLPLPSRIEAALRPMEETVRKNRLRRALEVYRFEAGKYPSELSELLSGGFISMHYRPDVDLAPIEYVTIGQDFELR